MADAAAAPAHGTGRHQRRLRNYLLDRHFQLKYSAYLVGIALVLSMSLGIILWRTSGQVIAQSQQNVAHGEKIVALGQEVVAESQKVSAVVRMNIVEDPVYKDNPALLDAFNRDSESQSGRLKQQQQALVTQAQSLRAQSDRLAVFQQRMLVTLCLVLALLVAGVGVAGIVVTHKVAGPVFKMKRQIKEVGDGSLKMPSPLRKGDELREFFLTFESMVKSLRDRQQAEIDQLEAAIAQLEGKAGEDELRPLRELRDDMKAALDA